MTNFTNQTALATKRMRELFSETPLLRNDHLSALYKADIWLKREDLSPVRSYKLRGAYNAMSKALDKQIFVCASAGNHAQGVSFVCRHMKKKGVIFMPVTTPQQKISKTKMFGGEWVEVRLVGDYFDDTLTASQTYCSEAGGHFLSPFDDLDVIEGQATVTYEMINQLGGAPDIFVVPVGGGGLSSSARRLLSEMAPETEIFFVEPSGGKSLVAALVAGQPTKIKKIKIGSYQKTYEICHNPNPKTPYEAKFSSEYCAAMAIIKGRALRSDDFLKENLQDSSVKNLMNIVDLKIDKGCQNVFPKARSANVEVVTLDGEVFAHFAPTRKGDPDNPLSDSELSSKYTDLVEPVAGKPAGQALLSALWSVENLKSIKDLNLENLSQ